MQSKDRDTKKNKLYSNNKAFSLIELLVSIAILAIIVLPLLSNFVIAARVNAKAKKVQNETILVENILEEIKAKPVVEFAKEYDYPADFGKAPENQCELRWKNGADATDGYETVAEDSNKSCAKSTSTDETGNITNQYSLNKTPGKTYIFAKKNIVYGNKTYDALITFDSRNYIETTPMGALSGYNAFQMPIISEINTDKNILAVQSYEEEMAVATLYGNHIAYCAKQNAMYAEDPSNQITPSSEQLIRKALNKQMSVKIMGDNSAIEVKVEFTYSCPSIDSCDMARYTVVDKKITAPMGSIYVFYNPSPYDNLSISKDIAITNSIDLYVVRQGDSGILTEPVIPNGINLYSNAINTKKLVKKEEAKNRIYDVKVQLYNAGKDFSADELCVEFSSTKEE